MTSIEDGSEESEDSLPLVVPNTTSPPKKKQYHPPPPRAHTFGGPQIRLGDDHEGNKDSGPSGNNSPPLSRYGSDRRENTGQRDDKESSGSAGLQRTKHGSPYPHRRGDKKGLIHFLHSLCSCLSVV